MSPQPGKLRQGALERGKAASWRRKGCCSQREQLSPGEEAWKQALRCLRAFASAVPPSKSALTSSPLSGPKQVSPPQRALLTPSSRLHSLSHAPRGPVLSLHGLIDPRKKRRSMYLPSQWLGFSIVIEVPIHTPCSGGQGTGDGFTQFCCSHLVLILERLTS